ncbi:unnamed protein product, partial [Prorocentrum cordatum]
MSMHLRRSARTSPGSVLDPAPWRAPSAGGGARGAAMGPRRRCKRSSWAAGSLCLHCFFWFLDVHGAAGVDVAAAVAHGRAEGCARGSSASSCSRCGRGRRCDPQRISAIHGAVGVDEAAAVVHGRAEVSARGVLREQRQPSVGAFAETARRNPSGEHLGE